MAPDAIGNERDGGALDVVLVAFEAFLGGDTATLCATVDSNLEWTYLDPSMEDPTPVTCIGRERLVNAAGMWAGLGLATELEELDGRGDTVLVIIHAPGLDRVRARKADDRNFHVATVSGGRVVAIRACRDRAEARARAGLDVPESATG